MQYRVDQNTGKGISVLGLGCMRFPRTVTGGIDAAQARAVIERAVERGINYLDTAYLYPGNEACVGAALEEIGLRDRVLLATKLPHASCHAAKDFDRFFDAQLERLRTDRIDYYLLHNVTDFAQWERLRGLGIEDWVARQKAAGRIGSFGFSYHGSAGDFLRLLDARDWDFCQIQYNYAGETYQAGTAGLEAAAKRGLAVFVMEPLLGGRLADKLPKEARRVLDGASSERLATPSAWGLSWVWNHPEVTMLLSGMTSPAMVDENAAIAERALPGSMTETELAAVARVLEVFPHGLLGELARPLLSRTGVVRVGRMRDKRREAVLRHGGAQAGDVLFIHSAHRAAARVPCKEREGVRPYGASGLAHRGIPFGDREMATDVQHVITSLRSR